MVMNDISSGRTWGHE